MSKLKTSQFTCTECCKYFKTKGSLRIHLKCHVPEQFSLPCPDCPFTSFQKSNLVKHMAVIHKKTLEGRIIEDNFACPQCEFKSVTESQLKNHLARKHTMSPKQYRCTDCEYSTIEKAALEKHNRIHTLERPYKCDICSFSFSTASGIARHRRSHSKIKPYQCPSCHKAYADKKRWKEHLNTHSEQCAHLQISKKFACASCKYATIRRDNLNTHIKRNHVDSNLIQLNFSSLLSSSSSSSSTHCETL